MNAEVERARAVAQVLRAGELLPDREFDRFLPVALRSVSEEYWTPLCVARRAVQWFESLGVRDVVDIGAGAGKFCVAVALMAEQLRLVGVEHRPHFVQAAAELARLFQVDSRVSFQSGGLDAVATLRTDAYYLFNPFAENLVRADEALDLQAELSPQRFERDVDAASALLQRAPSGTAVLVYNGFGAALPAHYERLRVDDTLPYELALWRKSA
jgi:hypothetical protein